MRSCCSWFAVTVTRENLKRMRLYDHTARITDEFGITTCKNPACPYSKATWYAEIQAMTDDEVDACHKERARGRARVARHNRRWAATRSAVNPA